MAIIVTGVFANENGRFHTPLISSCSKTKCRQVKVNLNGEKGNPDILICPLSSKTGGISESRVPFIF